MRTQPGYFSQHIAREPRIRSEETDKRRDKSNALELNTTARKQLRDLPPLYTPHVRIPGVIDMIVIPQDKAIVLHHAEHLRSHLVFHHGIEHGGEDSGLHDEIECCIG